MNLGVDTEHGQSESGNRGCKQKLLDGESVGEEGSVNEEGVDEADEAHDLAMERIRVPVVVGD